MTIIGSINPMGETLPFLAMEGSLTKAMINLNFADTDFYEKLLSFAKEYNGDIMILRGPNRFIEGVKQEIEKQEMIRYKENKLNIILC